MSQEFCESRREMCDPRDCNREFCTWRDTVWAPKYLEKLTYQGPTDWIYKLGKERNNKSPKKKPK